MSKKNQNGGKKQIDEGYAPKNRGYKPRGVGVTGGHKPEKSEMKPINPPKKK